MSRFTASDTVWLGDVNRPAIAVSALCCAVFFGALIYAIKQIDSSTESYAQLRAKALSSKNQTINHYEELVFLSAHEASFNDWLNEGKIGPSDEMARVETLLKISAKVGARVFRYQITESRNLESLHGQVIQQITVSRSDIRVDFEADHGATVFEFFTEVQREATGIFAISAFSLERIESELPNRATQNSSTVAERGLLKKVEGGVIPAENTALFQESSFGGVKVKATLSWLTIDP
jgi:hypothetical protein